MKFRGSPYPVTTLVMLRDAAVEIDYSRRDHAVVQSVQSPSPELVGQDTVMASLAWLCVKHDTEIGKRSKCVRTAVAWGRGSRAVQWRRYKRGP